MISVIPFPRESVFGCVFCEDAPCSKACGKFDCAAAIKSLWFDNVYGAKSRVGDWCLNCSEENCEREGVCPKHVKIKSMLSGLTEEDRLELDEGALKTDLCGIEMDNPFMLSSSVVCSTYDMCARAFDMGWAGVAFKTISTMEIHEASPRFSATKGVGGSLMGFKNIEQLSDHSVVENLKIFSDLKKKYPKKIVIASIMGQNEKEWTELSKMAAEAGCDALELNFSCPNMTVHGTGSDVGQIPELVERYTQAARFGTNIPILAKMTPNIASMQEVCLAAKRGGASGMAAINTLKSIVGINPHTFVSAPSVRGSSAVGGYSGVAVKPIALRFISEIGAMPEMSDMHISAMGGIETWRDALEFILLGSDSVQVTTAVMQYGFRIIDDLKEGLMAYLAEKGVKNVRELKGLGLSSVVPIDEVERDTVIYPHFSKDKCIGCGRCYLSCRDGGHQAIEFASDRVPRLYAKKCVGCHLCILVCPENAIKPAPKRVRKIV